MRSKRRRERRRNRPTEVYRLLGENLKIIWLVCILSGLVFFIHLLVGFESGFSFIRGIITLFMGMLFVQSVRAIIKLNVLKKMLLNNHIALLKNKCLQLQILNIYFGCRKIYFNLIQNY